MTPDYGEVKELQRRMRKASRTIQQLARVVGQAKTVIRYDADRRKQLLAQYMVKYLKNGESAVGAEAQARADEAYGKELDVQQEEVNTAEGILAQEAAELNAWDTCRSLLSWERESFRNLENAEY